MYCVQNNRIYCSDCNKSYIPNNYWNHLKSKGHYINVMKKQCDKDITHYDNNNLTCCMDKLSLTSNDNVKNIPKKEQTKEKYKNIDPDILLVKFRKLYTGNYYDSESISEAKAMLHELYRNKVVTWAEYIFYLNSYINKDVDENCNCIQKTEIIYLNNKMPCTQNRIYCGVCHISVLPDNYQNHLRSQGHASNVLKNSCTNSMIIKTHNKKR